MRLKEVINIEQEVVESLRARAKEGDNEAAAILLAHLRRVSKDIAEWQKAQNSKDQD